MNFFVQIIWFLKRKVKCTLKSEICKTILRAKRNIYELLLPTDDITVLLLCVFQIIVGCRGVKNDLFVVLHRMYCTYVAMPKTEGNERGVKIIPTFLRRHAKYKVSQRKIHIFLKGILTMMIIVYLSRVAKIQNSSS